MPDQKDQTSAEPAYITRARAAELAKVDPRTIDRWIKQGHIKTKRPPIIRGRGGIRILVRTADVLAIANAAPPK